MNELERLKGLERLIDEYGRCCSRFSLAETVTESKLRYVSVCHLKKALLDYINKGEYEPIGWMIIRHLKNDDEIELVYGPLTDDHIMYEGDEAIPIYINEHYERKL